MRMRQSLAQYEAAFREEAVAERERRERLRHEAAERSRVRRVERRVRHGNFRFVTLVAVILLTTLVVTVVMFETLTLLLG
ncbi:MAG TPA: hypothetical protein VNT32_09595 [Thermoleophilaceae bacterium]|nr:hypothetical protein [Thermoleophilaceae bacterium]